MIESALHGARIWIWIRRATGLDGVSGGRLRAGDDRSGSEVESVTGDPHSYRAAKIVGWSPRTVRRCRERYDSCAAIVRNRVLPELLSRPLRAETIGDACRRRDDPRN